MFFKCGGKNNSAKATSFCFVNKLQRFWQGVEVTTSKGWVGGARRRVNSVQGFRLRLPVRILKWTARKTPNRRGRYKKHAENCQRVFNKTKKKNSVTPPSQDTFTQQSETKRFTLSILPINLNHRQFSEELKKGGWRNGKRYPFSRKRH